MKRIILSIGLLAIALTTTAQGDYNYILSRIEANSTTLQSLREQMEAQKTREPYRYLPVRSRG